jgi:hypothetical protein
MRALIAASLLLPASALAQATVNVPQVMGYQGRLLKADGSPVTGPENPSQVNIIFRIFGQEVGGTSMWEEKQTVLLTKGFYAVFLGSEDSKKPQDEPKLADVLNGDRWLELEIEGDSMPLTPRQKFGSVAYAFRSAHAASAETAANVSGGTVNASGGKFTGPVTVPTPTKSEHAATMGYVDSKVFARSNLPAVGQQISGSSGDARISDPNPIVWLDVPNLNVTISTSGRPVMLLLVPDGEVGGGVLWTNTYSQMDLRYVRDGTEIAKTTMTNMAGGGIYAPPGGFSQVDVVGGGTHTYKLQFQKSSGGSGQQVGVRNCKLVAYEL